MLDVYNKDQHPVATKEEGMEEYSETVFIIHKDGLLNTGFFHFGDNEWYTHGYDAGQEVFKWMYPPKELLNSIKE